VSAYPFDNNLNPFTASGKLSNFRVTIKKISNGEERVLKLHLLLSRSVFSAVLLAACTH